MDIRKIDDDISVSPQISADDVAEAARLGFKTLVANRPDGEELGQPAMADLEAAARNNNLTWVYQPVQSGHVTDQNVEDFDSMIRKADKPVLAFCRSGTRCTVLWALSAARTSPKEEVTAKARQAGYDVTGLSPRLIQQASNKPQV
jgi:sulfide:quinone oxidoreductase